MKRYDHKKIEAKWQRTWAKQDLYKTSDKQRGKKNFYLLVEFPYPSGNLHVGHWYAFSVPDILARAMRMQGKNVLYPIGFDAFGLPAENAAIKNNINPRKWTEKNVAYMKKQIESMGTSFDWSREVATYDPAYYKWTQWQFLQFFKNDLAYQKDTPVNWCPSCKTVLANEQVINGRCERCDSMVEQKSMLQWNLKITDYADRLLDDLDALDWPEQIKESQRNWIGRSEGAEIDFPLALETDKTKYTYVLLHGFTGTSGAPRFQHWKSQLEKQGHEVVIPQLPNTDKPSEEEQVKAALKVANYDENTILFGASLGAVVAMKVVERLEKPIARLVLAGGFCDPHFKDKHRNFEKRFEWKFDGAKIRRNVKTIQILHDVNDYAVGEQQLKDLEKTLGVKAQRIEGEAPHFTGKRELPVLRWLRPTVNVFTTRADTLFGATYLVLAPEHPFVEQACASQTCTNTQDIRDYVKSASNKTELERQESRDKTGVELRGVSAINPATGKEIPVWIADYVLGHYGTGAIMAVPAHDERDGEFAKKFGLPIQEVVVEQVGQRHKDGECRRVAVTVVENKRGDILMQSKKAGGETYYCLPGGGVDKGETVEEGALRETREETGYGNFASVEEIGTVEANFFNPVRSVHRRALATGYAVKLADERRSELKLSEREVQLELDHTWMPKKEALKLLRSEKNCSGEDAVLLARYISGQHKISYTGEGALVESGEFSEMESEYARKKMAEKYGALKTTYKMRDWVVSRQRYWGVPIPIIHCPECGPQAVRDVDLPVKLPEVKDYLPDGRGKSPLAKAKNWVSVKCPKCKGKAERETDTFDTFIDSSWYFLRYTDPNSKAKFADAKKLAAWMPIDLYSGGAEHTTVHVLYSRFWQKALYDLRLVKDKEPYTRRMNRSLIMGPDGQKMSKSRGNVIDPDAVVEKLGADTVRMYLAFIGPYNEVSNYPWNPDGVVGVRRFLERTWRVKPRTSDVLGVETMLHKTIKKVSEDVPMQKFNTAIAQMMIFLNVVEKNGVGKRQWETFLRLLAPFAPHIAEELWQELGHKASIHKEKWPKFDAKKLLEETVTIAIQINGKTRGEVSVETDASKDVVEQVAREAVKERLDGKTITRTVVVPNRLVNFVVFE